MNCRDVYSDQGCLLEFQNELEKWQTLKNITIKFPILSDDVVVPEHLKQLAVILRDKSRQRHSICTSCAIEAAMLYRHENVLYNRDRKASRNRIIPVSVYKPGIKIASIDPILTATVPVVKLVEAGSDIHVDVSVNSTNGLHLFVLFCCFDIFGLVVFIIFDVIVFFTFPSLFLYFFLFEYKKLSYFQGVKIRESFHYSPRNIRR